LPIIGSSSRIIDIKNTDRKAEVMKEYLEGRTLGFSLDVIFLDLVRGTMGAKHI
jgi:hypothetical protein